MKVCGIIVEYNPLHNGHIYHIEQVKKLSKCDILIAVMSGNFTQRGEPSIINKHLRTALALEAGIDIVVELPYVYAVGHADLFSFGAVSLLNQCGVDEIIFGSETNDINLLTNMAKMIDDNRFNEELHNLLKTGISYPEACNLTLKKLTGKDFDLLSNDLLGIQYIRYIMKINQGIAFKTIKRIHTNYNDTIIKHQHIASATSIREALKNKKAIKNTVPDFTLEVMEKNKLHFWNDYYPYLKYQIMTNKANLSSIHDISEGIENAIIENNEKYHCFTNLVESLVSKRYTKGKIRRILTHILNNVTKEEVSNLKIQDGPQYLRILGLKESKSYYLKNIKQGCEIPLITNINKYNYQLLSLDLRISEVYNLPDGKKERKIPIIYKD